MWTNQDKTLFPRRASACNVRCGSEADICCDLWFSPEVTTRRAPSAKPPLMNKPGLRIILRRAGSFDLRSSADAFPQVIFLIQLIDLRPLEIAARDDAPDPSILDDR